MLIIEGKGRILTRTDLTPHAALLAEHLTNIPKVIGSISPRDTAKDFFPKV